MTARVLIVDDEPAIRESVAYALRRDGFDVREAPDLAAARRSLSEADCLVLDLMLPDGSGLELIGEARRRGTVPIIVLSSRDSDTDRVVGLELGADDYVTKPFSPRELVARVRAVLRRAAPSETREGSRAVLRHTPLEVDLDARRASVDGRAIELTKTELDLLIVLLRAPDRVFTRRQLLERAWEGGTVVQERTVDVHVKSLRRKLTRAGAPDEMIETVRGVGYRLVAR